jgi:hypothetical protein
MMGAVLAGSVLGMLAGAGCLIAGMPVLLALAVWSGTGSLAVLVIALVSLWPRRRAVAPVLQPQRA